MAELATGAVNTLLGVIRNEAQRLGRVRGDVQFIQEEMESMNSFLAHLGRTRGEEQDEQVRTWMNQVRILANDCNNCLDVYLYRRNPDFHRPKRGLRRHLWWGWALWWLREIIAQHRAAGQLRALKERARDVGERRLRYGVKVSAAPGHSASSSLGAGARAEAGPGLTAESAAAAQQDYKDDDHEEEEEEEEEGGDDTHAWPWPEEHSTTVDDYFNKRIVEWIKQVTTKGEATPTSTPSSLLIPSIAFVLRDTGDERALELAGDALAEAKRHFSHSVMVDVPAVHWDYLPLRPKEILYYILREMKPRDQLQDLWDIFPGLKQWGIYYGKKIELGQIKTKIQETGFDGKIEDIKKQIDQVKNDQLKEDLKDMNDQNKFKENITKKNLVELLRLLINSTVATAAAAEPDQVRKKAMRTLSALYDEIIKQTADKLKEHMEAEAGSQQQESQAEAGSMQQEPQAEAGSMQQEPQAEAGSIQQEPQAEAGSMQQEPQAEAGSIQQEPQAEAGSIQQEPQAEAGSMQQEPQAEVGSIQQEPQAEAGSIQQEPQAEAGSIQQEPQAEAGSMQQEPQAEAGSEQQESRSEQQEPRICLTPAEYEHILKEEFSTPTTKTATSNSTSSTLVQIPFEEIVNKVKDMLQELQENKSYKNQEEPAQPPEAAFRQAAEEKIQKIQWKVREQLKIKGILQKIKNYLKDDRILVILKTNDKYLPILEETRNSLTLLDPSGCFAGAVILMTPTTTENSRQAKPYFRYPHLELIEYSLVGVYFATVLEHTRKHMGEDKLQIVRNILEVCGKHEFCMKIFTQALIMKPKRSTEELRNLHSILQATPESLPSIARKMLKFSYNDLPKQHKSCLLYLSIFPSAPAPESRIRRSTLIGRWVAEGLITTEDWSWSSSVLEAEKCFDALIKRHFVRHVDIGCTGRVKTCMVDRLVHGFISKIAMKRHIVETRLAHHLARHFSIFNDVRLRRSDTIETFLKKKIHNLPQFSKIKVLDLEGCRCFAHNKSYLKDICSKILMLKYLSLRRTDVAQLPREINNLHELEVLDIRQTNISTSATRKVLLLKLKRLLASRIDPSGSNTDTDDLSVDIPEWIEKMSDVEVLSNVKPRTDRDLKDIGGLSQLRKLGVAIDKDSHLHYLLQSINDLGECLRSLSITLRIEKPETQSPDLPKKNSLQALESLSISGSREKGQLLPLLVTNDSKNLAKVTLSRTLLKPDDLKVLAKLGNLRCVRLRQGSYTDSQLTFEKDEFPKLELLMVHSSDITKISFNGGAPKLRKIVLSSTNSSKTTNFSFNGGAPNLEKIVLSFTDSSKITKISFTDGSPEPEITLSFTNSSEITDTSESPEPKKIVLSGIDKLRGLKELELIGDISPGADEDLLKYSRGKNFVYKHIKKPEYQDQATRNASEKGPDVARWPSFWKGPC